MSSELNKRLRAALDQEKVLTSKEVGDKIKTHLEEIAGKK